MATAPKNIEIPIAGIINRMTVNVKLTGYHGWYLRSRIGIALMRFAVLVLGMGFRMEEPEDG